MLFFLATSLAAYGGDDGMTLVARSRIAGIPLIKSECRFYWLCFVCLLLAYALSRSVVASRFGRVLRGTRENMVRMEAIGFHPSATNSRPTR